MSIKHMHKTHMKHVKNLHEAHLWNTWMKTGLTRTGVGGVAFSLVITALAPVISRARSYVFTAYKVNFTSFIILFFFIFKYSSISEHARLMVMSVSKPPCWVQICHSPPSWWQRLDPVRQHSAGRPVVRVHHQGCCLLGPPTVLIHRGCFGSSACVSTPVRCVVLRVFFRWKSTWKFYLIRVAWR